MLPPSVPPSVGGVTFPDPPPPEPQASAQSTIPNSAVRTIPPPDGEGGQRLWVGQGPYCSPSGGEPSSSSLPACSVTTSAATSASRSSGARVAPPTFSPSWD